MLRCHHGDTYARQRQLSKALVSSGVHGGLPTTGVISSPELDSEALHFDA
jgi:hypothetical protein